MTHMHAAVARRARLTGPLLAVVLSVVGCSSGEDGVVDDDAERTASSFLAAIDGVDPEYCRSAAAIASHPLGLVTSQDAGAAVADLEQLAALAPTDLAGAFDTLVRGVRAAELDQDVPSASGDTPELMSDPEVAAAAESIERFTVAQCDVDLGAAIASDVAGAIEPGPARPGADEITLAEVKAIFRASEGATWVAKLTTINIEGLDVQLRSEGAALEDIEAVAACTTIWLSLSEAHAEVSVAVATPQGVVAQSTSYGCDAA